MKPQKLSIVNGRRTTIDFDSRKGEYLSIEVAHNNYVNGG